MDDRIDVHGRVGDLYAKMFGRLTSPDPQFTGTSLVVVPKVPTVHPELSTSTAVINVRERLQQLLRTSTTPEADPSRDSRRFPTTPSHILTMPWQATPKYTDTSTNSDQSLNSSTRSRFGMRDQTLRQDRYKQNLNNDLNYLQRTRVDQPRHTTVTSNTYPRVLSLGASSTHFREVETRQRLDRVREKSEYVSRTCSNFNHGTVPSFDVPPQQPHASSTTTTTMESGSLSTSHTIHTETDEDKIARVYTKAKDLASELNDIMNTTRSKTTTMPTTRSNRNNTNTDNNNINNNNNDDNDRNVTANTDADTNTNTDTDANTNNNNTNNNTITNTNANTNTTNTDTNTGRHYHNVETTQPQITIVVEEQSQTQLDDNVSQTSRAMDSTIFDALGILDDNDDEGNRDYRPLCGEGTKEDIHVLSTIAEVSQPTRNTTQTQTLSCSGSSTSSNPAVNHIINQIIRTKSKAKAKSKAKGKINNDLIPSGIFDIDAIIEQNRVGTHSDNRVHNVNKHHIKTIRLASNADRHVNTNTNTNTNTNINTKTNTNTNTTSVLDSHRNHHSASHATNSSEHHTDNHDLYPHNNDHNLKDNNDEDNNANDDNDDDNDNDDGDTNDHHNSSKYLSIGMLDIANSTIHPRRKLLQHKQTRTSILRQQKADAQKHELENVNDDRQKKKLTSRDNHQKELVEKGRARLKQKDFDKLIPRLQLQNLTKQLEFEAVEQTLRKRHKNADDTTVRHTAMDWSLKQQNLAEAEAKIRLRSTLSHDVETTLLTQDNPDVDDVVNTRANGAVIPPTTTTTTTKSMHTTVGDTSLNTTHTSFNVPHTSLEEMVKDADATVLDKLAQNLHVEEERKNTYEHAVTPGW